MQGRGALAAIFTLSAKFKIEQILIVTERVYILCHEISGELNFFLSDASRLNDSPIEKWLDIPRAYDELGNFRDNYFAFVLKDFADKGNFKVGELVILSDEKVLVNESYKFSDGRIIAFLKCNPGKFERLEKITLKDSTNKMWNVKQYITTYGSIEGYEKIQKLELENIFQYLLSGINHQDKPEVGSSLTLLENGS